MIHYDHCPACKVTDIGPAFSARDFTVSNEDFEIWKCNGCTLLFTQDIPSQQKIAKYYKSENYISHSDTEKGLINKLYHLVRKRTLGNKRELVENEAGLDKGSLLDIGCGTGAFLNTMQEGGWKVTGLEPDSGARDKALSLYNIQPLLADLVFALPEDHFNAITAWHVMEHVYQLHEYIQQVKKLLKQNGKFFIAVPNYTSADAAHYQSAWAAYDVPRHLYHFSPKSMSVLMEMHGMKIEKIKPMWFDSFYVSMLSEKYKNRQGNIVKAFFNGMVSNIKALSDKKKCSSLIYIISKTNGK